MRKSPDPQPKMPMSRRHLLIGWWSLLGFLSLGLVLELLHAFKIPWYLGADVEIRRLMWRLAHAHGTLLSLIHLAFAASLTAVPPDEGRRCRVASVCLTSATVLLPGGFFLGGVVTHGGDPGSGAWLVPVGALLLFVAVWATSLHVTRGDSSGE